MKIWEMMGCLIQDIAVYRLHKIKFTTMVKLFTLNFKV